MAAVRESSKGGDVFLNILNNSSNVSLSVGDILPVPIGEEELSDRRKGAGLIPWANWSEAALDIGRRRGFRDGVFVRGATETLTSNEDQSVKIIAEATLKTLEKVKDGHFPKFGMVSFGFIRELWLDLRPEHLKATVWCRLTTDACPMGAKMIEEANSILNETFKSSNLKFEVSHGGRAYSMSEGPVLIRSILEAAIKTAKNGASDGSSNRTQHGA